MELPARGRNWPAIFIGGQMSRSKKKWERRYKSDYKKLELYLSPEKIEKLKLKEAHLLDRPDENIK
jgi:hypothetical protein